MDKVDVNEGRRLLKAAGWEEVPGSLNGRGEVWISPTGNSAYIPYNGPPWGVAFDRLEFERAMTLN
jgi:hypothetical protein